MWNLKYNTNEIIYETEIDSQTQRTACGCQGGWERGGIQWEFEVSRCKLIYIK